MLRIEIKVFFEFKRHSLVVCFMVISQSICLSAGLKIKMDLDSREIFLSVKQQPYNKFFAATSKRCTKLSESYSSDLTKSLDCFARV